MCVFNAVWLDAAAIFIKQSTASISHNDSLSLPLCTHLLGGGGYYLKYSRMYFILKNKKFECAYMDISFSIHIPIGVFHFNTCTYVKLVFDLYY